MAGTKHGDTRPVDTGESYDDLMDGFVGSGDPAAEEFQAPEPEELIDPLAQEYDADENEELAVESSDDDDDEVEEEDSQEESLVTEDDSEPVVQDVLPDIDYVMADGKKIKIDFTNRVNIKKAFSAAAGMRSSMAKYDKQSVELEDVKAKLLAKTESWDKLEALKDSKEDLWHAITGENLEDYVDERLAEKDKIALMNPEQLAVYERGLEHDKRVKEVEKREAAIERQKITNQEAAAKADHERQAALVDKAYLDNGFTGQLGDADLEEEENDDLWHKAIRKLSKYEDGVDVELINQTFKEVADHTRKVRKYNQVKTEKKQVKAQTTKATKAAAKVAFTPKKKKSGMDELLGMDMEDAIGKIFS